MEFVSSDKCVVLLVPEDLFDHGPVDVSELSEILEVVGPFGFAPGAEMCDEAYKFAESHGRPGMIGLVLSTVSVVDPSNN